MHAAGAYPLLDRAGSGVGRQQSDVPSGGGRSPRDGHSLERVRNRFDPAFVLSLCSSKSATSFSWTRGARARARQPRLPRGAHRGSAKESELVHV